MLLAANKNLSGGSAHLQDLQTVPELHICRQETQTWQWSAEKEKGAKLLIVCSCAPAGFPAAARGSK